MKIINLIIYSNTTDVYKPMFDILNKYYSNYKNIKTYFISFDNNNEKFKNNDYYLDNNLLIFKGIESLVPGVLNKTLKALHYCKEFEYDYIVRTNISTIINYNNLIKYLEKNPINFYGGGENNILSWNGGGINDDTWYGTNFISGTSIILSKKCVNFIIENENKIIKEIVDDVSLGILFREHYNKYKPETINSKYYIKTPIFIKDNKIDIDRFINFINEKEELIFYRNRTYNTDRQIDVFNMNIIYQILLNKINNN